LPFDGEVILSSNIDEYALRKKNTMEALVVAVEEKLFNRR